MMNMCLSHIEKLGYAFIPLLSFHFANLPLSYWETRICIYTCVYLRLCQTVSVESALFFILMQWTLACGYVPFSKHIGKVLLFSLICILPECFFIGGGSVHCLLIPWPLAREVVVSGSLLSKSPYYICPFLWCVWVLGFICVSLWPDFCPVCKILSYFSHNLDSCHCKSSKHVHIIYPSLLSICHCVVLTLLRSHGWMICSIKAICH